MALTDPTQRDQVFHLFLETLKQKSMCFIHVRHIPVCVHYVCPCIVFLFYMDSMS